MNNALEGTSLRRGRSLFNKRNAIEDTLFIKKKHDKRAIIH